MFKFGRLKTVEERKITGSYGKRRAVNPVLINVWELHGDFRGISHNSTSQQQIFVVYSSL
jgi:hypothetical protein